MIRKIVSITMLLCILFNNYPVLVQAESNSGFEPRLIRGVNTTDYTNINRAAKSYKANSIRYYLDPRSEAKKNKINVKEAWKRELDNLELVIQAAARNGMVVVIDLHELPYEGSYSQNTETFWDNTENLELMKTCWKEIVVRFSAYRDYIWGYDLMNEPYNQAELPAGASSWPDWAQQVVNEIRLLDKTTPVIVELSPGSLPSSFRENNGMSASLIDDNKVIYSFHMYSPHEYTHQGLSTYNNALWTKDWPDKYVYPGKINNVYWDKNQLRKTIQPVIDFQKKYNVPIYVGEFSAIRWAPGSTTYISDCIELFEELGWSWAYHSFAAWHGWSVEHSEQMTSDNNSDAARLTIPSGREKLLKKYFQLNTFLPSREFNVSYKYQQGGILWSVDRRGNIYKNGRYIQVSSQNIKFIPKEVIQLSRIAKSSKS